MGEEAEYALAVVGRHADDAFFGNGGAVVAGLAARTSHQSAAVEIDQHGQGVGRSLCRRPDVQVETVLAAARASELHVAEDVGLHGFVAEHLGLTHALPGL